MEGQKSIHGFEVFTKKGEAEFIYAAPDKKERFFRIKKTRDGVNFLDAPEKIRISSRLGFSENPEKISEMAIARLSGKYFLTYTKKEKKSHGQLYGAVSKNGRTWKKTGPIRGIKSFGALGPGYHFDEHHFLYFGGHSIKMAFSTDLKKWDIFPKDILKPRSNHFDQLALHVGRVLFVDDCIVLFYSAKNAHGQLCLGVAVFDKNSPTKLLWRPERPIWKQPADWEKEKVALVGIIPTNKRFIAYFQKESGKIFAEELHYKDDKKRLDKKHLDQKSKEEVAHVLERFHKNPILEPRQENHWEAAATFNPAAIQIDGRVHLIYRAQGHNGISVFGYASSRDGVNFDERSDEPVFLPSEPFEFTLGKLPTYQHPYMSGGGWGGCEDPRLSKIENSIYMTYVAFNGQRPPGVALTSISAEDFLGKKWNWKKPRLISKAGEIQKNWVIFPEKIKGKFAILHSISPKIMIDYVDDLDSGEIVIESYHNSHADKTRWDNIVRGVGAPPIKTEFGWLVLYHAMDRHDPNRYKVGAMLLDLNDPEKILCRSKKPILEPVEKYENEGYKAGVVYVCGAVVKDGTLFVYYGGADTFSAVASAPLQQFLGQLMSDKEVTLVKVKIV